MVKSVTIQAAAAALYHLTTRGPIVNVLSVCLADRGRLVTRVMLACWLMEGVRAKFTKVLE